MRCDLNEHRSLRSVTDEKLVEPFMSRLTSIERCFEFSAPRMFNSLPLILKKAENGNVFKRDLKTFIFTQAYDLETNEVRPEFRL